MRFCEGCVFAGPVYLLPVGWILKEALKVTVEIKACHNGTITADVLLHIHCRGTVVWDELPLLGKGVAKIRTAALAHILWLEFIPHVWSVGQAALALELTPLYLLNGS
jgi:hypothetical protein